MPKAGFYAVRRGHLPGIYTTWPEAEAQVKGFNGAQHKKFSNRADAQSYIEQHTSAVPAPIKRATVAPSIGTRDTVWRRCHTDGACPNNGTTRARAGLGVHWEGAGVDLSERLPGPLQTNQRGELFAIVRALQTDPSPHDKLEIVTDSQYSIDCLTKWIVGWQKRGWKNSAGEDVKNKDILVAILALIASHPGDVRFKKVKGHSGDRGNDQADALAVAGAALPAIAQMPLLPTQVHGFLEPDVIDVDMLMTEEELAELETE